MKLTRNEIRDEVLRALPAPGAAARSTPSIRRIFNGRLDAYEREVYVRNALDALVADGLAERVPVDGDTRAFWRLTVAGQRAVPHPTLAPRRHG